VDVSIPRGAIYGVLGPSGAGKTTLVKCVGLVTPFSDGSLSVLGEDASNRPAALRKKIGYMPQLAALYEELSARFNVEFFGRGAPRERIDKLLAMVNLAKRADDAVGSFSGGMKQRVSLACALVAEPELLLLDEPTAGIDPVLRITFWEEFRRLRDQGKTLLVSTHQIDEASHCDRLLIIRDGKVLVEGTPEELLGRGGATVKAKTKDGRELETRLEDPPRELPRWLEKQQVAEMEELRVKPDTLEEILVRIIRERGQA
jgi:ABC-2 type transport system ATP-binding protein